MKEEMLDPANRKITGRENRKVCNVCMLGITGVRGRVGARRAPATASYEKFESVSFMVRPSRWEGNQRNIYSYRSH